MIGPPWMLAALGELGTLEVPGVHHNPRILAYHGTTTLRATDDETPWCSAFVNWCVQNVGVHGTQSALARSWLPWGVPCGERYGAIVVLRRGTAPLQGHVGFLVDASPSAVWLLGGNQANRVGLDRYERTRVLGMRWPVEDRAGSF